MHEDCFYKQIEYCEGECPNLCVRYEEMMYMLRHSNLPQSHWGFHKMYPDECDVPAFEHLADIQSNIKDFVQSGNNLYLYSKWVGNGKTTWAVKMLMQYFHEVAVGNCHRERGLFINVPTYLMQTKNAISRPNEQLEDLKQLITTVDLLILDDITAVEMSKYDYATLLGFVEPRIFSGKATFCTGNYEPNRLSEVVGERLASRICSGETIELSGKDMRK